MRIDSDLDWSRQKLHRIESWTIDGHLLNSLRIYSAVKPKEHVFLRAKQRRSQPNGPWFKLGMREDEIQDLIVDALKEQSWTDLQTSNLRPAQFGPVSGLRFDFDMTATSGLLYSGTAAAAVRDGRLTSVVWYAPREYYFGRDQQAVNKLLDSIQFLPR